MVTTETTTYPPRTDGGAMDHGRTSTVTTVARTMLAVDLLYYLIPQIVR